MTRVQADRERMRRLGARHVEAELARLDEEAAGSTDELVEPSSGRSDDIE